MVTTERNLRWLLRNVSPSAAPKEDMTKSELVLASIKFLWLYYSLT